MKIYAFNFVSFLFYPDCLVKVYATNTFMFMCLQNTFICLMYRFIQLFNYTMCVANFVEICNLWQVLGGLYHECL